MDRCLPQFEMFKNRLLDNSQPIPLDEAEQMVEAIYTGHCIDTTDRFHNLFFYEICPLTLIARHVGIPGTKISFTGRDARFDGVLHLGSNDQKIEMTTAIDGHQDAIRLEYLKLHGHAPAFQEIKYKGTSKKRIFNDNDLVAIESKAYNNEILLPILRLSLNRKIRTSNSNENYLNAWLGIVFDDWIEQNEDRKKERFSPLCRELLAVETAPFFRVFCLGVSRKYIFDSNTL